MKVQHQNLLLLPNVDEIHKRGKKTGYEIDVEDHFNNIVEIALNMETGISPFVILHK